jgi:hypothetical protein
VKIEDIRELRNANPFRPFELITGNGRAIKVERRLSLALAPNGRSVAGYDPAGRSFYLPLTEISELRVARNKRANRNGS